MDDPRPNHGHKVCDLHIVLETQKIFSVLFVALTTKERF